MSAMRSAYWQDESSGQVKYLIGALLLHAVLGVLLIGFNWRTKPAVVPQLAINATLVDRNTLNQLARVQAPPSPPAPVVDDKKQEQEKQKEIDKQKELEQQQREQQEREKQLQDQKEQDKKEQLKQQQVLQQQAADKQRLADEAKQKEQADQQRKAAEQQKQQQEAEKKRLADIQQKQRDVEAKRQADADAKAQAAKEAELKAQLAAEEGRDNAVNSGLQNVWMAQISQKIQRNWFKPPTATVGVDCELIVKQSTTGTVLSVEFGRCNGDAALRQSIEAAVYSSSPLPPAPDPRIFDRDLRFPFRPKE